AHLRRRGVPDRARERGRPARGADAGGRALGRRDPRVLPAQRPAHERGGLRRAPLQRGRGSGPRRRTQRAVAPLGGLRRGAEGVRREAQAGMDRALAEVAEAPGRERLRALLSPRSVAVVGASERSGWSSGAFGNFDALGFDGVLHLVNRGGGVVHGRESVTSCVEIGEPVDLAIVLVGAGGISAALADVAAAGIPYAVVLAAGFAETGEEGAVAQHELVESCGELGVTLVGPNCLGFVNVVDRAPAWAGMMPVRLIPGSVAI